MKYSDILQEIHRKELCKGEDFTALGIWCSMGWSWIQSQDPKSCILAGHGSSHITADPTKQGRMRLQQFRPGGAIDGTAGRTATPPVFGAIQDSYGEEIVAFQYFV